MTIPADYHEATDVDALTSLAVVEIRPGDTIVLMHPRKLSDGYRAHIAEALGARFPACSVLVLEEGMTMAVARPEPMGFIASLVT